MSENQKNKNLKRKRDNVIIIDEPDSKRLRLSDDIIDKDLCMLNICFIYD